MAMSGIRVQLQQFEGPLDLLLYLIRKEEMDIFNINIVDITKQYFDYIKLMKEFDIEVAGDFIAMASTLIHIKSKMLLPQYDENGEVVEAEDPRKELVQKLLEYEKYKEQEQSFRKEPVPISSFISSMISLPDAIKYLYPTNTEDKKKAVEIMKEKGRRKTYAELQEVIRLSGV